LLSLRTAGESHGHSIMAILEGLPAGIKIDKNIINYMLRRRKNAYGRGGRMQIESDDLKIISGIRNGLTIGSPIGLLIKNKDWANWQEIMSVWDIKVDNKISQPRPGHADFAGSIKYNFSDIRNVLERASARETAIRTAAGAIIMSFLRNLKIDIISHVIQLGEMKVNFDSKDIAIENWQKFKAEVAESPFHCFDKEKEEKMINYIDQTRESHDTLGGICEIRTTPLPPGLGSYTSWDKRLDSRLTSALMSIPAVKGVEFANTFADIEFSGSEFHDELYYNKKKGYYRNTNRAGGLEGGITNGSALVIKIAMKPIPTLYQPLETVDMKTKKKVTAQIERSDVTALPAAGVVAEALVAYILADAIIEKFGGDNLEDILNSFNSYKISRGLK